LIYLNEAEREICEQLRQRPAPLVFYPFAVTQVIIMQGQSQQTEATGTEGESPTDHIAGKSLFHYHQGQGIRRQR
jgi:hypothetical protein